MEGDKLRSLLRNHGLRVTPARIAIVEFLAKSPPAMGQSDIEKGLTGSDRVTIYRALRDLEHSGVIHTMTDNRGTRKFALCHDHCKEGRHVDHHVHFSCTNCDETFCLHHVPVPQIRSPRGYAVHETNLLLTGICKQCAH